MNLPDMYDKPISAWYKLSREVLNGLVDAEIARLEAGGLGDGIHFTYFSNLLSAALSGWEHPEGKPPVRVTRIDDFDRRLTRLRRAHFFAPTARGRQTTSEPDWSQIAN